MGQKVRLSEAELKNYVTENIKKVLNEMENTSTIEMGTCPHALVKYVISRRGVLEQRKYDKQRRLAHVYQQIVNEYKGKGAYIFNARFVGYEFTFIISEEFKVIVLLAIVPGGALTGNALLQRVRDNKDAVLTKMLRRFGYNPRIFGLRNDEENQQANNIMEEQEYGNSLLSVLATVAQYMEDFGYNEESQLIEKYIGSAMSEDDIEFNNQILQAIENVEKDVTRRREESDDENVHWDDFEDFVSMLSSARQRYLLHFGDDNPKYTLMNVGINRPPKRYLSESFIRKTIKESIKKVLGEEWYPEEDDDISDYSYGAIYNIYIGDIDMNEMDPQVIEALNNVKDETVENENSYISCLIQNVILKPDQFNAYELYVNVAVSAPDMPTNEIEREVVDVIWYWIERKTGKRFVNIQLQDEKPVFDRRVRNS